MKRVFVHTPLEAAIKHKQNRSFSKLPLASATRIGAALLLPLLLLPAAITPAYAAAVPPGQQLQTVTESLTLLQSAPYFRNLPTEDARASLGVSYYEQAGAALTITGRSGELLQAVTPLGEKVYVPAWYTENAAASAKFSSPLILQLQPDARLHLFPDSEMSWPSDYALSGAVSAIRYGDWYGLSLPADPGYVNGSVTRPALLWVDSAGIQSTQSISGVLAVDSTVPTDMVRSLTETALQPGTPEDRVLDLLGEPFSRTQLPHFSNPARENGEERGTLWRYERSDAQLTVSFNASGKLLGWDWILPTSEAAQAGIRSAQPPYAFKYDFRSLPPAASVSPEPLWQVQSPLDAQYLLAAAGDVLLVQGDDALIGGGGGHMASSVSALDRSTGRRLWERDAGYGRLDVLPGEDGRSVLVLTDADPENDNRPVLRSIRLNDGAVRWSREVNNRKSEDTDSLSSLQTFAAGTSVLLSTQPSHTEKGTLTVFSQSSGSVRWTKTFADPYTVLNKGSQDSYVLIRQGRWIQALDPRNGQAVWSLKADEDMRQLPASPYAEDEYNDLFAETDGTRWITLGGDRIRLNTATGEILGRYPIKSNERIDQLDSRYLLIRRAIDTTNYAQGSLFESVLYDSRENREVWSVPGRAANPLLDGERLYVLLNGVPTALSTEDGQQLWKTPTTEFALAGLNISVQAGSFVPLGSDLLLPYGPDLLAFDAETGKLIRRIDGFSVVYNENNSFLIRNGLLASDGEALYAGSANGLFTAWDAQKIIDALDK